MILQNYLLYELFSPSILIIALSTSFGVVVAPFLEALRFVFLPDTLSGSARTFAAILMWVVVMWITEPIPLPVTALLGCGLCVLAGIVILCKQCILCPLLGLD